MKFNFIASGITFDTDIDNAKEKLNEAIKEGVFGKNKTTVK